MTGYKRTGWTNDGNGLPRTFRLPQGDLMTTDESPESIPENPHLQALITLLEKFGLLGLSQMFQDPEVISAITNLRRLVPAAPDDDAPNDAHANAPDFGIALEQEFLIRNDKGETEATLYFEEVDPMPTDGPTMWIDSFSVAKALRGQGVAKALMRLFLEKYGMSHIIFLRARPFNDAPMSRSQLIVFYHNWGFEELLVPTIMVRYPHGVRYKGELV
jgi:GNAT superfamily N-acetyltransferase